MKTLTKKSAVSEAAWKQAKGSPYKVSETPDEIILDIPQDNANALNESLSSGAKQDMSE